MNNLRERITERDLAPDHDAMRERRRLALLFWFCIFLLAGAIAWHFIAKAHASVDLDPRSDAYAEGCP
jgi:hypothetical protein